MKALPDSDNVQDEVNVSDEQEEDDADSPYEESVSVSPSESAPESAPTETVAAAPVLAVSVPEAPEPTVDEIDLTTAESLTADPETQEVSSDSIDEKLEDVDLTDDQTTTASVSSLAREVSPTSTPPSETNTSKIAPPLPSRNAKKSPFAWFRQTRSSDRDTGVSTGSTFASTFSSSSSISKKKRSTTSRASTSISSITSATAPNYDLLLSRIEATKLDLQNRDASEMEAHLAGTQKLRDEFEALRKTKSYDSADSEADLASIDWDFWTLIVSDYSSMAKSHPTELSHAIQNGLPPPLRGTIWQLMASSKSSILEEVYTDLITETSPHEKMIHRDLSRTSFAKSVKTESLFNVLKAYTLFDPEVGYIQGMAFITVPLVLVLKEEEAFCLLVNLMKIYLLRDMFLPEMPALHLRLYQFDRILEETVPKVHTHLARQGVISSMYASQWFLTLFAYKFPLPIVLRIFDIVVAEGLESILRFAVALMKKNADSIIALEFDTLVNFLKEDLFDAYVDIEATQATPYKAAVPFFVKGAITSTISEVVYRVNDLVADAYEIKIVPETLKKYEQEYIELHRVEKERQAELEGLKSSNAKLSSKVKELEASLGALNQEHVTLANELVQLKMEKETLTDKNTDLTAEMEALRATNSSLQAQLDELPDKIQAQVETNLKTELDNLMTRNLAVMDMNRTLQDQLTSSETELADIKVQYATINQQHQSLNQKWSNIRKVIGTGTD
ncbi:rab-GTPase-TBC domain-containing protein [Lipomyces oligophaga]|uniref:rab-GTPase-TBC domain-containing protein n=1 Tax=Lipomyces oligophaga TaxID=45792 RepID=UPI0034CF879D